MENQAEGTFDPIAEATHMKQNMLQFHGEVAKLRGQAEEVRKKTLVSIQNGIQKATKDGLHQVLFPNSEPLSQMANTKSNVSAAEVIGSGQQALAYSDALMAQMLHKVSHHVNAAMANALNVTADSQAVVKLADKKDKRVISKGQKAAKSAEVVAEVVDTIETDVAMAKAQNAVVASITHDKATAAAGQSAANTAEVIADDLGTLETDIAMTEAQNSVVTAVTKDALIDQEQGNLPGGSDVVFA